MEEKKAQLHKYLILIPVSNWGSPHTEIYCSIIMCFLVYLKYFVMTELYTNDSEMCIFLILFFTECYVFQLWQTITLFLCPCRSWANISHFNLITFYIIAVKIYYWISCDVNFFRNVFQEKDCICFCEGEQKIFLS